MEHTLTIENGPDAGRLFRLELGMMYSLGRAPDAQVRLPATDPLASRYHAVLQPMADGVELRDLQSRNGTFVNGARVDRAHLSAGDRLRIGRTEMLLLAGAVADTLRMPPADVLDALKLDDDLLDVEETAAGAVARAADSVACDSCGHHGPAPGAPFVGAARICSDCAGARREPGMPLPKSLGPYQIIRLVGRGSAGVVYEARHGTAEAHVALKALVPEAPLGAVSTARFLREQRLALTLSHPRIVRCYDVGQDAQSQYLYLATEWLPGGDAESLCSPQLQLDVALSLGADIFEALAYLHGRGLIHRDVKPANLLLVHDGPDDVAGKLSDFGIAKNARETGTRLTLDRDIGGTPLYAAPEQLLDFKWVGRTADIYGGAASLYSLLAGVGPLPLERIVGEITSVPVWTMVLDEERVPLQQRRPEVPQDLADWIDKAVARDPKGRESMDTVKIAAWLRALASSEWS